MAEFAYNNAKNASSGYTLFELNYGYHPRMSYKNDVNLCFKSKLVDKLSAELRKLIIICKKNPDYTQKLEKWAYNKSVKSKSYIFNDKVWLNSKYIKTKQNRKLKTKFFRPFQVLHSVKKQVYKLDLPRK